MLKTLYIKNYALIDELTIEFGSGLNIITGETGAGKSILIGALGVVLGDRSSAESVRKGSEKAVIEAIIEAVNNKRVEQLLKDHDFEVRGEMILRREISAKGQSRCFINDSPATLALLKEVGDLSIDLHGQHDHQSLLRVESHIRLLDEYGGLGGLVEEFQHQLESLKNTQKRLTELRQREKRMREQKELHAHQIREIDSIAPEENEEEDLQVERTILENSEKLYSATNRVHDILYSSDDSVHNRLVEVRNILQDLARIDKSFADSANDAYSAQALVDEITKFAQSYNSRIEFNPERLADVRERLMALQMLRKKYGGGGNHLSEVIRYRKTIAEEIMLVENFVEEITKWERQIKSQQEALSEIAERLSAKRKDLAKRLSKAIPEELKKLGIANARFEVSIKHRPDTNGDILIDGMRYAATASGYDYVEFLITTNLGEDPKPLVKTASGGEVSRVMLALKTVLAKSDRLPILVFDEIDTGVSGKVAQAVGFSMKDLARYHQIIAITHLPQIAAMADVHFQVRKEISKERTMSVVAKLSHKEHQREVARLLSGAEVTDASLKSAQELIAAAR